jgi:hypothetical protein
MLKKIMACGVVYSLSLSTQFLHACPKGSTEWEGTCSQDIQPESAQVDQSKWVSDEKSPKDKMPSWQREGIHVVDAPNMTIQDAKEDAEKNDADIQGKRAAGLR